MSTRHFRVFMRSAIEQSPRFAGFVNVAVQIDGLTVDAVADGYWRNAACLRALAVIRDSSFPDRDFAAAWVFENVEALMVAPGLVQQWQQLAEGAP